MYDFSSDNLPTIIFFIFVYAGIFCWWKLSMRMTPYVRNLSVLIPFFVSTILFFLLTYKEGWEYYFVFLGIAFLVDLSYEFFPHKLQKYNRNWIPRSDTPRRGTVTFLQDFLFLFSYLLLIIEILVLISYHGEIFSIL